MIRERVEELVACDPEWAHFFEECCKTGPERLRAQVWQFYNELAHRNLKHKAGRLAFTLTKVENALLELATELLPETPAGSRDPRALLFRDAVLWVVRQQPDKEIQAEFTEGLDEVWANGTLREFREELRSRMRAAVREAAA